MEKSQRREIKRIRHMLDDIVGLAEDEELPGGILNAVKRFNSIVRHLESSDAVPHGLFQALDEAEGAISFHQVGIESRMLAGYLEEIIEQEQEDEEKSGKPDFSPVIALAPFLDQADLQALVHSHLSGRGFTEPPASGATGTGQPDLRALVGLAPHITKRDLAEMVETCLQRGSLSDPNLMVALAPHMDRQDLGRLLRQYLPGWFDSKLTEAVRSGSEPPGAELTQWEEPGARQATVER